MTEYIPITGQEDMDRFCEYWLANYSKLSANLSHPRFSRKVIRHLVTYELHTRRRKPILARLVGRYYRMERNEVMAVVMQKRKEYGGERKNYRGIFSQESEKFWRESI